MSIKLNLETQIRGTLLPSGGGGGIPPPNTHEEILTDGSGNFILAGGDIIMVLGVPN